MNNDSTTPNAPLAEEAPRKFQWETLVGFVLAALIGRAVKIGGLAGDIAGVVLFTCITVCSLLLAVQGFSSQGMPFFGVRRIGPSAASKALSILCTLIAIAAIVLSIGVIASATSG